MKYVLLLYFACLCNSAVRKVVQLSKKFTKYDWKREAYEHCALSEVTLDFTPRGVHTLIGTSGSGKSTLLKLLSGMEVPTSGTIDSDGAVGTCFIDQHFYATYPPLLSLQDVLNSLPSCRRQIYSNAFEKFKIPSTQPAQSLLESDRRLFEVILALSRVDEGAMPILCLDEWMDKDFKTTHKKLSEFFSVACQNSNINLQVLIATHSKNVLQQFSDHVVVINKGRIFHESKGTVRKASLPAQLLVNMID